jgi:adenine deaminase
MDVGLLVEMARGDRPVPLVLRNARVIDVLGGEIVETHVGVAHSRIVGFGDFLADTVIDLEGAWLAPGFIDAHVHVESAMVPPGEFARAVVPHGTTTVVTDPHEIANVLGLEGIRFMFDSAKYGPLSMYVMASSCVPATGFATSGAVLRGYDIVPLKSDPWVLGLAEVMNVPGVVTGDEEVLSKLKGFDSMPIDGHSPGLSGPILQAYVAAGVQSDHECTRVEEAREKLRLGMMVLIREGSVAHNLRDLLPLVTPANQHRTCFCTDDRHPADLLDEGHIDHLVRLAIAGGLDPITAIGMATWNPATHFRLWDRGAITPGRRADLVVFHDLGAPRPHMVFRGGQLVARDGRMTIPPPDRPLRPLRGTMNVAWDRVDFAIPLAGRVARVIGLVPDRLETLDLRAVPRSVDGRAESDPASDLLKVAVIERHLASGRTGMGFVRGLGLQRGAIASSVAHDHHNLVVAGVDDRSMLTAVRHVANLQGGWVVAEGDRVLAAVPLPLAGLMSDQPLTVVREEIDRAHAAAAGLGATIRSPFMMLSFVGLEVIPRLRLTDRGLVDVDRFDIVPLWDEKGAG